MTFYVLLLILFLMCWYFGQVFGLMIHCDNCVDFKPVKRYVYLVPVLRVMMLGLCLADCFKEKNIKMFFAYIFCSEINIMILCAMLEMEPELQKIRQRSNMRRIRRRQAPSPLTTVKSILFETQDYLTSGRQYM